MEISKSELLNFAKCVLRVENLMDNLKTRYSIFENFPRAKRYDDLCDKLEKKYMVYNGIPLFILLPNGKYKMSGVYVLVHTLYKLSLAYKNNDILYNSNSLRKMYFTITD